MANIAPSCNPARQSTAERFGLNAQLTLAEAADVLGVSLSTMRRLISRGELRAYYYGPRVLRIDPADLRKMRREVNPATYAHVSGGDVA